jgi:hypothetical protein
MHTVSASEFTRKQDSRPLALALAIVYAGEATSRPVSRPACRALPGRQPLQQDALDAGDAGESPVSGTALRRTEAVFRVGTATLLLAFLGGRPRADGGAPRSVLLSGLAWLLDGNRKADTGHDHVIPCAGREQLPSGRPFSTAGWLLGA